MSKAQFLSAMLKPIGAEALSREERKYKEKLQAKRDRFELLRLGASNPDLTPEDRQRMSDELWREYGGATGKNGRPNPGMQILEKIMMSGGDVPTQSSPSPMAGVSMAGGEQPPRSIMGGVSFDGAPAAPAESAFRGLDMGGTRVAETVRESVPFPTEMGDPPRLRTSREKLEEELRELSAREEIQTQHTLRRNGGRLVPGASVTQRGDQVPPDVETDADGQPIVRTGRAEYRVMPYQDGRKEYVRIKGSNPTGVAAKIQSLAQQLQAVARSQGRELSDDDAEQMAAIEIRVNEVADRQLRVSRVEQLMEATELQMKRGTQAYEQAEAMFPLTMAAKRAGIDLAQTRLEIVSGNPVRQLAEVGRYAMNLKADRLGAYASKPLDEIKRMVAQEWFGRSLAELEAEARAVSSRDGGGASAPKADDPLADPDLRAKAKKYLDDNGLDSTNQSIDTILRDPANVKALRGGG